MDQIGQWHEFSAEDEHVSLIAGVTHKYKATQFSRCRKRTKSASKPLPTKIG